MDKFVKTLYAGNLEEAKTLYYENNIDLNQMIAEGNNMYHIKLYHRLILDAADNNFIHILKWLLEIDHDIINDISVMSQAFTEACFQGYMDMAEWLLSLNCIDMHIDIHFDNETPFRFACMGGKIEMAKWLLSIDPDIDIHVNSDDAFWSACGNGHLEVAQWLYGLDGKINISHKDVDIINELARRDLSGEVGVVSTWLKTLIICD